VCVSGVNNICGGGGGNDSGLGVDEGSGATGAAMPTIHYLPSRPTIYEEEEEEDDHAITMMIAHPVNH